MSKSLGNFTSLTDLLEHTDARAYRLLVIRSHYRSPIEVSPSTIGDAERALSRLDALARRCELPELAGETFVRAQDYSFTGHAASLVERVGEALDDDLNTPLAVGELFDAVSAANSLADEGKNTEARDIALAVAVLFGALGLNLKRSSLAQDEEILDLVRTRDQARREGDWALADRVRDDLVERGWIVEDSVNGTRIRKG